MRIITIILPLILLAGCEFRYRYECQDPANWDKAMCNNDKCKAEGSCTSDVLGFTPGQGNRIQLGEQQKFNQQDSQSISNSDCPPPAVSNKFKPNTFKPNKPDSDKRLKTEEELYGKNEEDFVRTPLALQSEKVLTMDTIVETDSHNKAIKSNNW